MIATNLLTKFHKDWTINVASRVLTSFNHSHTRHTYSHIRKIYGPLVAMFFKHTRPVFKLVQDVIETYVLTKFHEDPTISLASRVKKGLHNGGHVFQQTGTISNSSKFHKDGTKNVASRVLTRKNAPPLGGHIINVTSRALTRKNAPPPGGHVFQATAKFHDDWKINVASRVSTRQMLTSNNMDKRWSQKLTMSTLCSASETIFELIQDIIKRNSLTKIHLDQTINVASRVLTRQM
ncbi:hypothetical protein DPMN_007924 [Dreissena polymorpha]|uniref:Uncharacterized protein n=1 Tax=Dreissena polymorpha TaxID=45954 RepID=A0A9D4MY88_DREPO|nr:hypothetical protein DPMN_007924 [Dreissena polymorpha]